MVQVQPENSSSSSKKAVYKLNTTVMLSVEYAAAPEAGDTNLSGNLTAVAQQTLPFSTPDDHLVNIGRMIEKMENEVRSSIDGESPSTRMHRTMPVCLRPFSVATMLSTRYGCMCMFMCDRCAHPEDKADPVQRAAVRSSSSNTITGQCIHSTAQSGHRGAWGQENWQEPCC